MFQHAWIPVVSGSGAARHGGSVSIGVEDLQRALRDRYAVERELDSGGMATVFVADDLKHHRQVAIKVLNPELAAAVGGERFLREIETTAQLRHPNILPLYDSGEADGLLYYVMPLVMGGSLAAELFYRVGSAVWAALVDPGAGDTFRIGERQQLFDGPYTSIVQGADYDVHPSGDGFVMTKLGAWPGRLILVQNFFEELNRLAPN